MELKVEKIEKQTVQADGSVQLDVHIKIVDDDEKVLEERRLGFPADIEDDDLEQELSDVLSSYKLEQDRMEAQAEIDKREKTMKKTIKKVEGKTIK